METVRKLANIWASHRSVKDDVIYYEFSEKALDVFTQKVVQECIEGFHATRIDPSIEKYLFKRLGINVNP